jgi:predicted metal-dependent phosphoesterase TrpH
MRCDLHVHTTHSGMCTVPVLSRVCLESYNEPHALYERLKQRGMNLVTVTDHDSIGAAEDLRRHPDFFLSEEVTCTMPSGTEMHAGVYGIQEKDHFELQTRRHDVESLLAYALENNLFVTVNHAYSSLNGPRTEDDFARFARDFHGVETLNGMMLPRSNRLAHDFARRFNKPALGGSDAHTLGPVGRTFTEVAGATTAAEFLAGLRRGQAVAMGESGDYWKLTAAVLGIGGTLIRRKPWMLLGAALFAAAPLVTLGNYFREAAFAWQWRFREEPRGTSSVPAAVSSEAAL